MLHAHVKEEDDNGDIIPETETVYCVCREPYKNKFMIACDQCVEWYHGDCINLSEDVAQNIDKYYCERCKASKPELRTTFKIYHQQRRKTSRYKNRKIQENITMTPIIQSVCSVNENRAVQIQSVTSISNMDDEELAHILQLDTSKRKAKSVAWKNIKRNESLNKTKHSTSKKNSCQRAKNSKENTTEKEQQRQCYGPGCVNPSRKKSKYCSDECGLKLGTNRILEILPQRLQQQKILPSAADESSKKKLSINRRKQKLLQNDLEQMDIKILQLIQLIQKSKQSTADAVVVEEMEDENYALDCKLCGLEVSMKTFIKHLEICFKKQERRLMLTGTKTHPDDMEWNIFCNQKMGRKTYCKQLRVLCPHHYKHYNEDEQCGYPFEMNLSECSGKFCGLTKRDCVSHQNCWEEILRAEMDMEKLQMLLKLSDLEKNENELRKEMAARGNVMGLLLHQTIVH